MRKKRLILITTVLLIGILALMVLCSCTNTSGPSASDDYQKEVEQKQKDREDDDYEYEDEEVVDPTQLNEGVYPSTLPSLFYDMETEAVQDGLQAGATTLQVRSAVLAAYNVANRSRKQAENSLMIQHTDSGMMIFNGFELKSGNAWYYQLPTEAPGLLDFLSYTAVAYTYDSETFYYVWLDDRSFPKCRGVDVFPYAKFLRYEDATAYNFDEFKARRFFLDDQLELCNMKFSLDLIDDTSEISYDADAHVYTVKLVVNTGVDAAALKEWYFQAFSEGNNNPQSPKTNYRTYDYWYATIEIWDNGYVKSLRYDEKWGTDNAVVGSTAFSEFKFFYGEDEILAIIQTDPRYQSLSEEEKAQLTSLADYVTFFIPPISAVPLRTWQIVLIALGCAIFAVIVIVVGIEVAVKKGRLPKLAAKREADKQKRLAKKAAKKGAPLESSDQEDVEMVEDGEVPFEEPADEVPAEESAEEPKQDSEE